MISVEKISTLTTQRQSNLRHPIQISGSESNEIALGDLAELVITERTAFCESSGFDSECYHNIFKSRYPDLTFEPIEGKGNVIKSVKAANRALGKIAKNAKVIGIIDGDTATSGDRKRGAEEGIRILSRKTIESYLLQDLRKLNRERVYFAENASQ